ncbi:MAG: lipopolysaccharide kinase InaA family protein [Methylococcales bacterium]
MKRQLLSKNNSNIIVEKNWDVLRIYHRQAYHPDIPNLLATIFANPDLAMQNGELLKDEGKTTLAKISKGDVELVIKRYNIINRWHAISRGFRISRAYRCWVYAHLFKQLGLDTPEPVAMIEERQGPIRKRAYYIMRFRSGLLGRTAIQEANPQQIEQYLGCLVDDLQQLYDRMITHGDLKATNWLWHENKWIWLDLDATRQHRYRRSFTITWHRDIRRLLKNWQDHPQILQQAKLLLPWIPTDSKK